MSYYAKYWSTSGKTLLGGTMQGQTSRFGTRADAQEVLRQAIELNNHNATGKVFSSNLYPEIFSHCLGSWAQAIGGHCFKCGKKLTIADAREYQKKHGSRRR